MNLMPRIYLLREKESPVPTTRTDLGIGHEGAIITDRETDPVPTIVVTEKIVTVVEIGIDVTIIRRTAETDR